MKKGRICGIIFIGLALLIFSFNLKITGAVIGLGFSAGLNSVALIFFTLGLALIIERNQLERNLAQQILRSSAVITDPKKIKNIAVQMGYNVGKEVKEGSQILNEYGKPLTVIPHHKISYGVYKDIMKSLSTGESNFRKYRSA